MLSENDYYLFPVHKLTASNIEEENNEVLKTCKIKICNKFQVKVIPIDPTYAPKWFDINYLDWLMNGSQTPYAFKIGETKC